MKPVSFYRYTLRSRSALNAGSVRVEHEGVLIRVGEEGGYGYGCIHPWPELGDEGLDQTLMMLRQEVLTMLSKRALACAEADGKARREGVSLFDGLTVPRSHATLQMEDGAVQAAVEADFEIVKVKCGRDLPGEGSFIRDHMIRFPELKWRFDFNSLCSREQVGDFLELLGAEGIGKIDFLEDAWESDENVAHKIPIAIDRRVQEASGCFDVAVVKPAVNEPGPILERARENKRRVVFTSYMDHPLGQCFAAWEAALAMQDDPGLVDACGLITHGLFEPDAFTDALGVPSPEFLPPAGTGLGFDDLLDDLPWTRLS